ncbi:hypothetical protein [Variovorax saccharolyticus]|uniref:hypothetical protein n=1 Tax=Variovorax saccharolyticus TaxID=3053516 RepID=UPI002577EB58|nr:hypothetical protein [Variovorax sp. J31P216]MDM0029782.1 hypothetical protein [Variovorax sp. J31P216]
MNDGKPTRRGAMEREASTPPQFSGQPCGTQNDPRADSLSAQTGRHRAMDLVARVVLALLFGIPVLLALGMLLGMQISREMNALEPTSSEDRVEGDALHEAHEKLQ